MKGNYASVFYENVKEGNQSLTIRPKLRWEKPMRNIVCPLVGNREGFCEGMLRSRIELRQSDYICESFCVESTSSGTTGGKLIQDSTDMPSSPNSQLSLMNQPCPTQTSARSPTYYQYIQLVGKINELRKFINKQVYERMQQMHRMFHEGNEKSIGLIMMVVKKLEEQNAILKRELTRYKAGEQLCEGEKQIELLPGDYHECQQRKCDYHECQQHKQKQQQFSPNQQQQNSNIQQQSGIIMQRLRTIQEMDNDDDQDGIEKGIRDNNFYEFPQNKVLMCQNLQQFLSPSRIVNKILELESGKWQRQSQDLNFNELSCSQLPLISNKTQVSLQSIKLVDNAQQLETEDSIEIALSIFKMYNRSGQEKECNKRNDSVVDVSLKQVTNQNKNIQNSSEINNHKFMRTNNNYHQINLSTRHHPQKENKIKQIISRSAAIRNHNKQGVSNKQIYYKISTFFNGDNNQRSSQMEKGTPKLV